MTAAPDFDRAIQLFSQYRHAQRAAADPLGDWIAEAQMRLDQAAWMIRRIAELQTEADRVEDRPRQSESLAEFRAALPELRAEQQRRDRLGFEVILLTEAFYYLAFRFCQICQNRLGFTNFEKKAAGIRDVRNHLIEHPHEVSNPNYAYGSDMDTGPVMKPFGGPSPRPTMTVDRGLYVNARELLEALIPRLEEAIRNGPNM